VINETMARRYWPGADPIGERIDDIDSEMSLEIVGVVADVPPFEPGIPAEPEIFWSNRQFPRPVAFVVVSTAGSPGPVARAAQTAIQALDPDLQVSDPLTLGDRISTRLVGPRFNMMLIATFAAVALALCSAGLFGLIAYGVSLRRREIGIRLALGARRHQVLASVVGDALTVTAAGAGLGLIGALVLARIARSLFPGVSPADPVTLLAAALLLALTALAATTVPARRASGVDPIVALKSD
jgi:ABC-type antimicrobial peptide transport system permease subunit